MFVCVHIILTNETTCALNDQRPLASRKKHCSTLSQGAMINVITRHWSVVEACAILSCSLTSSFLCSFYAGKLFPKTFIARKNFSLEWKNCHSMPSQKLKQSRIIYLDHTFLSSSRNVCGDLSGQTS